MKQERPDLLATLRDGTLVDRALARAMREALISHKRTGDPVSVWRDGKVVWVPADEIEIRPVEDAESLEPAASKRCSNLPERPP